MKNVFFISIVLAAVIMTLSCEKEEWNNPTRVSGEGDIVSQRLHLDPYSQIVLEGVANIYLTVGDAESAVLKAQKNIVDVLSWKVSSGVLTIDLKEGISLHNHKEIRFEISTPYLEKLVHDGIGDVSLEGAAMDDLEIDFRGIGHVLAYGISADRCLVLNSGMGNCKVRVQNNLEVDISSLGKVFYRGNPEITYTNSGMGELINDN